MKRFFGMILVLVLATVVQSSTAWAFQVPQGVPRPKVDVEEVEDVVVVMEKPAGELPDLEQLGPNATLDQIAQVMTEKLRPTLRAELRFLTSAAGPSPDQRRAIAIEGSRHVVVAAKKLAKEYQNNALPVQAAQPAAEEAAAVDCLQDLRNTIARSARKTLNAEQFSRFQKENEDRTRENRRTIVTNLIANMDQVLFLHADQRTRLEDSLLANWNDLSFPVLAVFLMMDEDDHFEIPEKFTNPILNQTQRRVWSKTEKLDKSDYAGDSIFLDLVMNNDEPVDAIDDPDEKAAFALLKQEEKTKK